MTAPKRATRGIRLSWSSPRTRDYHTHLWAFYSEAVTTCFYDLGLLRLGFEHRSLHLRGKPSNRLHHIRGFKKVVYNEKRPSVQEYHAAKKVSRVVLLVRLQGLCFYACRWFPTWEKDKTIISFFCSFVRDCIVVVMLPLSWLYLERHLEQRTHSFCTSVFCALAKSLLLRSTSNTCFSCLAFLFPTHTKFTTCLRKWHYTNIHTAHKKLSVLRLE